MASLQKYLDFKTGDFSEIAALESYGMKSKRTFSQAYIQMSKNVPARTLLFLACFRRSKVIGRVNHEPNDPDLGLFSQEETALARTEIGSARPITAIQSSFRRRHR